MFESSCKEAEKGPKVYQIASWRPLLVFLPKRASRKVRRKKRDVCGFEFKMGRLDMSIKEKRKSRKDYRAFADSSEKNIRSLKPNLYKRPNEREELDERFFKLSKRSDNYRKEISIKGIDSQLSQEIALTSWL